MNEERDPNAPPEPAQNVAEIKKTSKGFEVELVAPNGTRHKLPSPFGALATAKSGTLAWCESFGIVVGKFVELDEEKPATPPSSTTTP